MDSCLFAVDIRVTEKGELNDLSRVKGSYFGVSQKTSLEVKHQPNHMHPEWPPRAG